MRVLRTNIVSTGIALGSALVMLATAPAPAQTPDLSLSFGKQIGAELPEVDSNGPTAIDAQGKLWFIQAVGGTMRSTPWRIYKGTTMDNLAHQYDYVPDKHWARPHGDDTWWAEGLWIDPANGTWYVVMHTEYNYNKYLKKPGTGYSMDRIGTVSLATSTDQGKSWTCHGEIIKSSNPTDPKYWEGKNYWDEARGDPALFVDKDYFYVYYNARWVSRDDPNVCYAGVRVARCRLADQMAPGKWTKWYQGKWDQPGLGGYDSDVFNENYSDTATVFWSKSWKCYVSIVMSDQKYNRATGGWEYDGSISTCTDLGKQDWTKPIQVCDKARKGYYTWVIDPKTRSRYVMESDTFRWYGTENRCRAFVVTLTNAPVHPVARPPLYPPESVDDHNPGWDRSFAPPASLKSQRTAKTSQAKVGPNPSPWSHYRFAPDAIQEIDLASDTAWSLSIDGGAERPIKVPAGGWNSERQEPRIDTWTGVKHHVIYRTKLVIPADASGRCVKLLLGSVNFGAEILIDGQKVGEHVGCMTPIALDITKVVTPGTIHDLQVKAFHRKHYGHPLCSMPVGFDLPAGCGIEGQGQTKYGYGINGYARLAVYPLVQIEDVFVRPSVSMQTLAFDVWIANRSLRRATLTLKGSLSRWSKSKVSHGRNFAYPALPSQTIEIPAGETRKVTVAKVPWLLGAESYWWPNMPYRADYQAALHWLNLSVTEAGCVLHERKERFGFVEHAEGPFYYTVNGVRYTSISDSISHGQVGNYDCFYETTCFQPADGKILGCPETWRRYQRIGFNTLRTSTSVPSPYMLETADEAGYLLIPEGGNWYHEYSQYHPVNTPRQLQDTLLACRNHPCVARYSLANESITSKIADSPDLGWRRLIDAALEIDDTRPYVFEELPGYVSTGIVQGMKQGHAYRMQHYDPIGQGGDRLRGMGELCWETDGMEALAVGVPALRLKDWTHFAPWSWVNYWPNFLEGMSHDRHPWTQNNHDDRHDGVDGWGSPIVTAIQRAFHPFLVVDTNTLNLNPAIKKYSLDITAAGPRPAPSYSAGSDFRREFQVFNGALAGKTLKLRWTARWDRPDGPKAAQGSVGPFEIEPGFHKPQTVEFKVPMPGRENRILFLVLESIRDGKVVYREDRLCFTVTTPSHQSELLRELTAASLPQAQLTTVRPHEIEIPLVNPFCGWGLWAGPRFYDSRPFSVEYNTKGFGDDAPLFSWVLIDWMWADLEPEEGQYAWNDLDTVVEYWKARGKQLIVRLWVTTDPGWAGAPGNKACPDWLWDAGVKYHEYKAEGGVKQRCPAYADPTWETLYLPKMKRFLSAYRDRYHKPGGPVVLDYVMGFGDWGEWHTMWSHYPWPSREKKREVLGKAIGAYLEVFAPKQPEKEPVRSLAIAYVYDDDCGGNTPLAEAMRRQALDLAAERGFAFARNGFIDGLGGWPNDLMNKYWSDHQLIGEGDWSYEQMKKDKTHGSVAEHVDAFAKFHSTYAHLYMHAASYQQAMKEDRGEHERALKAGGIGYRFALTSATWETTRTPGQTLTLRQEWGNRNRSWCVYPYRLKLYLLDGNGKEAWSQVDPAFDPRPWLGGTTNRVETAFQLPSKLKPGTYELRLALVDETGKPRVRLAIEGGDAQMRYRLGSVKLSRP